METINHECYVSPEVSKLLERAGFDWKCKYAYIVTPKGDMPTGEEGMLIEYVENVNWLVKAPTLEVAQKWLREVKGHELWVYPFSTHYRFSFYGYLANEDNNTNFDTYEEALEAGIKKCLTLILNDK